MKKTALCVMISSILAANVHAMSLEEASPKIRTKLMELAELAKDPANVVEENGERRLQYNDHKYSINFDGNIKFGLFGYDGNYGEFDAVFGFLPKEWEKYAYDGGFDLYPEGFDAKNCTMGYYPAARGSNGPDGKPIWERETQILVDISGCTVTEKGPFILFNTNALPNVLEGSLHGGVLFAQAHIIPAKDTSGEKRQHLVAQRKTMVMFKPEEVLKDHPVQMTACDAQGNVLGTLDMRQPDQLTRNVMHVDVVDDPNIDWSYEAGSVHEVRITNEQSEISSTNINNALAQYDVVKSMTKNYGWVQDITLTDNDKTLDGKLFISLSQG